VDVDVEDAGRTRSPRDATFVACGREKRDSQWWMRGTARTGIFSKSRGQIGSPVPSKCALQSPSRTAAAPPHVNSVGHDRTLG
jgi:hypothetical protein